MSKTGSDQDTRPGPGQDRAGQSPTSSGKKNEAGSREERLAEALRANLRRRKSSAKARKSASGDT